MSSNGWYSKQDVLKDPTKATGKHVDDFGGHCVVGAKPPPTWRTEQDNEVVSRFYEGQKLIQIDNMEKPDLAGITQMLRMVDNFDERSSKENKRTENKATNIIVSISKLDPNVGEFVPSSVRNTISKDKNFVDNKLDTMIKDAQLPLDAKTAKTDSCNNIIGTNVSKNLNDITGFLSDESKEMREKLKTKITETSKTNRVKQKRERNLAIATLLKLHCKQPAEEKNPNLISPEYYINNSANINVGQIKDEVVNRTNDSFNEHILNASTDTEIISKEIAASVEKVTMWLHSSETARKNEYNIAIKETQNNTTTGKKLEKKIIKGPSVHLGPVTFKRKTNNNPPMSPVSLQSDNSKTTKSEAYVPSDYANELTKKYIQQSEQKQKTQMDMWTNIENKLKGKDEVIKKQRLVQ